MSEAGLDVALDRPLPGSVVAGRISPVFCVGTCFHAGQEVEELAIVVGNKRHRPSAQRMPRPDRSKAWGQPEAYRSGFWGTILVEAPSRPGPLEVGLETRLADGSIATATLGTIEVTAAPGAPAPTVSGTAPPAIAICMATFNPDPELLRVQIGSIRAQTADDWICMISDDCSDPELFAEIAAAVEDDGRFVVSRADRRLGFYRNFERALGMVPEGVEFIALSDQDDRWYADKLDVLRSAIGAAELAYSDVRRVDEQGRVRAPTLWARRRNNRTNLASLLVSNTMVGAACLFRRRVADRALPFPQGPGWYFHDHWIALVALTLGDVEYVDRPLYDYVQHPGAVLGQAARDESDAPEGMAGRVRRWFDFAGHWRAAYFSLYLQRQLMARLLLARCGAELTVRKRRALRWTVAAEHSPLAFAWLAGRRARTAVGFNETLGGEGELAKGILWRRLVGIASHGRPNRRAADASMPRFEPRELGSRQRRWLVRG